MFLTLPLTLSAPTKLESLSDHIVFSSPCLDTKCLSANMNKAVVISHANS